MTSNRESRSRLAVVVTSLAIVVCALFIAPGATRAQDTSAESARHRLMDMPRLRLDADHQHDLKLLQAMLVPGPDLRVLEYVETLTPETPDSARIPPSLVHGFQDQGAMEDIVLVPFPPS